MSYEVRGVGTLELPKWDNSLANLHCSNQPEDATIDHQPKRIRLKPAQFQPPKVSPPLAAPKEHHMNRTPDKLPDPWLFDSEKLLRELDRCREMVLLIPATNHETHFACNIAINGIWNLREQLRYLLGLH